MAMQTWLRQGLGNNDVSMFRQVEPMMQAGGQSMQMWHDGVDYVEREM